MIDKEKLTKDIRVISQDAWKSDSNTTLNTIVEHICRETLLLVVDAFEARFKELEDEIRWIQESKRDQIPPNETRKTRTTKAIRQDSQL